MWKTRQWVLDEFCAHWKKEYLTELHFQSSTRSRSADRMSRSQQASTLEFCTHWRDLSSHDQKVHSCTICLPNGLVTRWPISRLIHFESKLTLQHMWLGRCRMLYCHWSPAACYCEPSSLMCPRLLNVDWHHHHILDHISMCFAFSFSFFCHSIKRRPRWSLTSVPPLDARVLTLGVDESHRDHWSACCHCYEHPLSPSKITWPCQLKAHQ